MAASDGISIQVSGLDEVNRALYAYSQQLGDTVVLKALREGAKVMQKQARANAPKRTGKLRRNITIKNSRIYSKRRGRGTLGVYLSISQKGKADNRRNAFYGRFIEHGTKHIRPRKFIDNAYNQRREASANVIIRSAERGAEIVARKTGLR
jgi:HK97 gp10 family phage protein